MQLPSLPERFDNLPGLAHVPVTPEPVRVHDPLGRDREFARTRFATLIGRNELFGAVYSVRVRLIDGRERTIPAQWARGTDPSLAIPPCPLAIAEAAA